jgi:hypothetical protein
MSPEITKSPEKDGPVSRRAGPIGNVPPPSRIFVIFRLFGRRSVTFFNFKPI